MSFIVMFWIAVVTFEASIKRERNSFSKDELVIAKPEMPIEIEGALYSEEH